MATNLRGVWLCMRAEVPRMLAQGSGAIVNSASILGLVAARNAAAYCAAKHAVVGLSGAAALDYAKSGLQVNAVCPGYTRMPMIGGSGQRDCRAVAPPRNPDGWTRCGPAMASGDGLDAPAALGCPHGRSPPDRFVRD